MAGFQGLVTYTMDSAADLSALQYHLVFQSAAKTINKSVSPTEVKAAGILQNKPGAAGRNATVADGGTSKVVAGAAIAEGKHFTSDANGRAVTVTSGDMAYGRALEAAGANGDLFSGRIIQPFRWSGAP